MTAAEKATFSTDRSTVTGAAPAGTVTLGASRSLVTYGGRTTLSGAVSTKQAGEKVDVFRAECGSPRSGRGRSCAS